MYGLDIDGAKPRDFYRIVDRESLSRGYTHQGVSVTHDIGTGTIIPIACTTLDDKVSGTREKWTKPNLWTDSSGLGYAHIFKSEWTSGKVYVISNAEGYSGTYGIRYDDFKVGNYVDYLRAVDLVRSDASSNFLYDRTSIGDLYYFSCYIEADGCDEYTPPIVAISEGTVAYFDNLVYLGNGRFVQGIIAPITAVFKLLVLAPQGGYKLRSNSVYGLGTLNGTDKWSYAYISNARVIGNSEIVRGFVSNVGGASSGNTTSGWFDRTRSTPERWYRPLFSIMTNSIAVDRVGVGATEGTTYISVSITPRFILSGLAGDTINIYHVEFPAYPYAASVYGTFSNPNDPEIMRQLSEEHHLTSDIGNEIASPGSEIYSWVFSS